MFGNFLQEAISELTGGAATTISILVGVAALGGITYKGLTWYASQNDKKALVIKTALEEHDKEVKKQTEMKAQESQLIIQASSERIQSSLDITSKDLQKEIIKTAELLKQRITEVEKQIVDLTEVVKNNFSELSNRADLTNGNVAHIRNDMTDLAADIQDLFDMVNPKGKSADALRSSREKDIRRRERKRQIETDRVSQMHGGERRDNDDRGR